VSGPGGVSPPGSRRTVLEPLDSYGSHYPTAGQSPNGFAWLIGSSPRRVARQDRLDNATPSFHPLSRASSLLWIAPTLCLASVLSPSWVLHLGFSLLIKATGSHVPHKSLDQVHATFMPDAAQASQQASLGLVPGQGNRPGFDVVNDLSTRHQWFTCVRLLNPRLPQSCCDFSRNVNHPGF